MNNYTFQLEEWLQYCSIEVRGSGDIYYADVITSPIDICNNEHFREALADQYDWGKAVPIDIFVMADGEPEDRHVTKIGGLPYRPADQKWPTNAKGDSLLFIGQINFNDSRDLTGDLPGDLLLVFADWVEPGYINDIALEWQSQTSKPIIESSDIPEQNGMFKPCYGYRCRTVSYPNATPIFSRDNPIYQGKEVRSDYLLLQYQGTQIGGAPYNIQPNGTPPPGKHLCVISSVQPAMNKKYPWVNQAEPIALDPSFNDEYLMIDDLGCIYIRMQDDGSLTWDLGSY